MVVSWPKLVGRTCNAIRSLRWLTEVDFKLKSNCSLTTRDGVRVRRSFHANVVVENQMEKRKKFGQLVGSREKEE